MNWEDVFELDMGELAKHPQHHPKCRKPEADLEGLTPNVTANGAKLSWQDEKGWFGHHCFTGQGRKKAGTRAERAKQLADAIGKVRAGDDEEAREILIRMSNEELAHVVLGSGAQKLAAIRFMAELANTGLAAPEVADPEQCPVGKGQIDCPICGGRHQPVEMRMSGESMTAMQRSLGQLQEIQEGGT